MTALTDIEEYYENLLIIQYHDKPKARETIKTWVDCTTGDGILTQITEAFNIDTAIGAQLDAIGKFVGIGRFGFNDNLYRVLIKFKILRNNIGSSMKDIDDAIYESFGKSILVNNDKDMSISYIINNDLADIIPVLISNNLLPRPLGVDATVIVRINPNQKYFGFRRGDILTVAVGFSTPSNKQEALWLSSEDLAGE